jgi:undecaprenyl diphosphate synthase
MEMKKGLHVGIVLDGNGRWATQQGKERLEGHAAGVATVKTIVRACPEAGVATITLFAFAIANWKRNKSEVDGLWILFLQFLQTNIQELMDEGVRIRIIGDRSGLPTGVLTEAEAAEERSKTNTGTTLQIALNYDGVDEVARMVKTVIENEVPAEEITSEYIQSHLDTEAGDDPDLVIRTGMPGAQDGMSQWRGSAFLSLQSVQSVCVSTTTLWPDFTSEHLKEIIEYADLDTRLFGGQRKEK